MGCGLRSDGDISDREGRAEAEPGHRISASAGSRGPTGRAVHRDRVVGALNPYSVPRECGIGRRRTSAIT